MATTLELLFDLIFVVAIAFAATQFHHALSNQHAASGLLSFVMVFFAIWWAWVGVTWFASAFDVDDVPYRIAVFVQMAGALGIAAGVDAAFEHGNLTAITAGYVVVRVASVAQWLRAAASDECSRPLKQTCRRYAIGIVIVQLGWVANLAVPSNWALVSFGLLVIAEFCVPVWAERTASTPWHPHHIAERYGLLTIIVLGESILAAALAMKSSLAAGGFDASLVVFGVSALAIVFCLWWIYFEDEVAEGLGNTLPIFLWGYGHFVVFASAAAIGSALALQVDVLTGSTQVGSTSAGWALALSVSLVLITTWAVHKRGAAQRSGHWVYPVAALLMLGVPPLTTLAAPWLAVILVGAIALANTGQKSPHL